MTQSEERELEHLREELADLRHNTDQTQVRLGNILDRLTCELRLYRGLFWCLLAMMMVFSILRLLDR